MASAAGTTARPLPAGALEELRREHTELKARIGKLEALGAKAAKPDEKAEARASGARKGKKR